jgi:molybdate transport system substrate-binding protein
MTCVTSSRARLLLLTFALTLCPYGVAADRTLTVAAAADLGPALQELATAYQQRTGTRVALVLGSSGNLTSQIEHGAPYHVFFSADTGYPRQLESKGLTQPGSMYVYAAGKLVLFVVRDSPLGVHQLGMRALLDSSVQKIAIANPRHAPYGRAAMAAIESAGLAPRISHKLVLGEDVTQAAQFVLSGNAQIGIIPLSLVLAPGMAGKGKYWQLPAAAYPPIEQAAVILKSTKEPALANGFIEFVKSPPAAAVLRRYGFERPETK